MEYPAIFEPAEEGGFLVRFPDFDWGVTQGDTLREAEEMAADAIRTMIRELIRQGNVVPRPSKPRRRKHRMIRLAALDATKVELYTAFQASGLRKAELARRVGIPKTTVYPRPAVRPRQPRSEERRVGKECRSRKAALD